MPAASSTALAVPGSNGSGKNAKAPPTNFAKASQALIRKHCHSNVQEEWEKVDDKKIAKLRGILAALQEENQSTQLLKQESEDKKARRALQATRASVETRLAACKEKEALFKKRQDDLRRHVMDNQRALQELESTIEKGEKKIKDEQAECRRLDVEISNLTIELRQKELSRELEQKNIQRTARYKQFLEEVTQDCSEEFEGDIEVLMNRYGTLESGSQELHQANEELSGRLDRVRDECLRVQTKLQNEHLMISSQLHECQVDLDHHQAESQELEQRLNRALEEKELKESQVGVIQMAIEQLFTRTVTSCRLKQRKKAMMDATDVKYAPLRGDKGDVRLEEMFKQILERVDDLKDMHEKALEQFGRHTARQDNGIFEMEPPKVEFVLTRGNEQLDDSLAQGPDGIGLLGGGSSTKRPPAGGSAGEGGVAGGSSSAAPKDNTFLTNQY